jgi:hypothetical protein
MRFAMALLVERDLPVIRWMVENRISRLMDRSNQIDERSPDPSPGWLVPRGIGGEWPSILRSRLNSSSERQIQIITKTQTVGAERRNRSTNRKDSDFGAQDGEWLST